MNLIKLNPLKKLMLVVLSWFVHAVYHVEVHAWHIGESTTTFKNATTFYMAQSGDGYHGYCSRAGYSSTVFYIFPGSPSLKGAFYVYHPGTNKYSQVPTSGVLCLTAEEFNAMQSFFGNTGQNWGNCMAINCCNGARVSCAVAATCGDVLVSGQMFPVLIASSSTMNSGSGFSTSYNRAYAAARVLIPGSGNNYTQSCMIMPKGYVANASSTVPSSSAGVAAFVSAVFKKCPAGYFCPGSIAVGNNMGNRTVGYGAVSCLAGHYCAAAVSSYTSCARGYYAYSMASSCTPCPSHGGQSGTTASAGTSLVSSCYIPSGLALSSNGHSFAFVNDCYYVS